MDHKEKVKEINKSNIQNALLRIQSSNKPISTQKIEIHTDSMHKVALSKVVITHETAQKIDDISLRIQDATLGVRYTLHDQDTTPALSASATIESGEIAFMQMYLYFDPKKNAVLVTSNLEVTDNYNDEDLQGYGLGSSFMPSINFDAREVAIKNVIKQYFPNAKQFVIMLKDFSKGKSGKDRKNWTTDLAISAGYKLQNNKLIKTVSIT